MLKVKNLQQLKKLIRKEIEQHGVHCDLNHLDVSSLRTMTQLFMNMDFQGDISQWNVSNVQDMSYMFSGSTFNGDLSKWDVSNVMDMSNMFDASVFQGDISGWNLGSVLSTSFMFRNSWYQGDLSKWDTSKVEAMLGMFYGSHFDGDISSWNTKNVTSMQAMFVHSAFQGDISQWDLSGLEAHLDEKNACAFSLKPTDGARATQFRFHESPLGFIGIVQGDYDFPLAHPRAAQFHELRSLCDGLNMDVVSAAQFIYQEMYRPVPAVTASSDVDFRVQGGC